jgi:hypothetical protein
LSDYEEGEMVVYEFDYRSPPGGWGWVTRPDGSTEEHGYGTPDGSMPDAFVLDEHLAWMKARGVTHVIDTEMDPHPLGDRIFDPVSLELWESSEIARTQEGGER